MIIRRKRLADGSFGEPEKVFGGETPEEKVERLEEENLTTMGALASVYEENLALQSENNQLQQDLLDNMEATAMVYEQLLTMQGGA
jgi:hypothetical protein